MFQYMDRPALATVTVWQQGNIQTQYVRLQHVSVQLVMSWMIQIWCARKQVKNWNIFMCSPFSKFVFSDL